MLNFKNLSQEERNKKFLELCSEIDELAEASGWGDWCGYNRVRELVSNITLGFDMPRSYAGPDGINNTGEGCEHKSTINEELKGNYRGLPYDRDFEVQAKLLEKKILSLPKHYFSRFRRNSTRIEEIWEMDAEDVYKILIPKVQKQHPDLQSKKDPRPSGALTKKEITSYGRKIK